METDKEPCIHTPPDGIVIGLVEWYFLLSPSSGQPDDGVKGRYYTCVLAYITNN